MGSVSEVKQTKTKQVTLPHKEVVKTSPVPVENISLSVLGKELMKLENCIEIETPETFRQPSSALFGFIQTVL